MAGLARALLLMLAMVIGLLLLTTVATEPAAAQEPVPEVPVSQINDGADPSCPDSYESLPEVADVCARLVPALQTGATCPAETRGPAGACYRIVSRNTFCEVGELGGDSCIVQGPPPVDRETGVGGPLQCPPDFGLIGDRCLQLVPVSVGECPATASADAFGLCREPVADRVETFSCLEPAAMLVGTDCVITVISGLDEPRCPVDFIADSSLDGRCTRFEPASPLPESCPEGARGIPGGCYALLTIGARLLECTQGELVGTSCIVTGPAPSPDPATGVPACGEGFGLVDGMCLMFRDPVPAAMRCPTNALQAGDSCRRLVSDAKEAFFCADARATLQDASCVFTTDVIEPCGATETCDNPCSDGFEQVNPETCTQTMPALVTGPGRSDVADAVAIFYCEDPTDMLQGSFCQQTQPALLARTGRETATQLVVALLALGAGATLLGTENVRRRR